MVRLSRALRRWDTVRVAAICLALAWLVILAAYAIGALTAQPSVESLLATAAGLAIAVTGLLYAWRLGTGGSVE